MNNMTKTQSKNNELCSILILLKINDDFNANVINTNGFYPIDLLYLKNDQGKFQLKNNI